MSILDRLEERDLKTYRPERAQLPCIRVQDHVLAEHQGPYNNQCKFALTATLAVEFYANPVQYSKARRDAERLLIRELYSDSLRLISRIRHHLMDDDILNALEQLDALETSLLT